MNTFNSNPSIVLNNSHEELLKQTEHTLKVLTITTTGLSFGYSVLHAAISEQILHYTCSGCSAFLALYFMAPSLAFAFDHKRKSENTRRFWQMATFFGSFAAGITLCML